MRTTVSVGNLKAHLSQHLTAVRSGLSLIVTDRGRPVARIDPVSPADAPEVVLDALIAAGLARGPAHPLADDFLTSPRPRDPAGLVLKALLSERGSGG